MFKEAKIPKPQLDKTVESWNNSLPEYNQLTQKEQQFLYWVNYSRKNPIRFYNDAVLPIVNIYPQLKGKNFESLKSDLFSSPELPMLSLNTALIKTSKNHSEDITRHNENPSHNSTSGESFIERFKKSGLKNCGGENISFSGGDGDPLFMLVLLYLDVNVPNLGHRKTLLNPTYVLTGIGVSSYKNSNTFLVEDFACKQN